MKFKVAILQKRSLNREIQNSVQVILEKMKEAAAEGADILVLPEAFITGYELPMSNEEAFPEESSFLRESVTGRHSCRSALWQQRSQEDLKSRRTLRLWWIKAALSL